MGRAKGQNHAVGLAGRFDAGLRRAHQATEAPVGDAAVTVAVNESDRQRAIDALGFGALLSGRGQQRSAKTVRPMNREFMDNIEEWKKQEDAFVRGAQDELAEGMREFARSGQWGAFLRMYTQAPEHSPMNVLWARTQLRKKWEDLIENGQATPEQLGDVFSGRFYSPSVAKSLGARITDPYFKRAAGFDDRYAVEMSQPMGFNGFPEEVTDANGNPVLDSKGRPKTRWVKTTPKSFGTFVAYHEKALVDADGNPWQRPQAPWSDATGSDEDAQRLLSDLERLCAEEGLQVAYEENVDSPRRPRDPSDPTSLLPQHATYDRDAKTVTVDTAQSAPEQAVAMLRAVCEHLGDAEVPRDDTQRKVRRAAEESAKYAVASLYGLSSEQQAFPYLVELADDEKAISKVAADTHRRVKRVMTYLDPAMRAAARAEGERKSKTRKAGGRGRKKAAACRKKPSA